MNKVYILTECGEKIGSGHITRMGALNEVLMEQGFAVSMFVDVKGETEFCFPHNVSKVCWRNEFKPEDISESIVVVDSYLCEGSFYTYLKKNAKAVVAIDDYGRTVYDADVVINPGISFYQVDYSRQHAKVLGGGDFTILRKSFRENKKFNVKNECHDLLVSVGAEDSYNIIPFLCENVFPQIKGIKFHIMTAKESYKKELEMKFSCCENYLFYGFLNERDIFSLMHSCDAGFIAAGQTLIEATAVGLPSVAFAIEKDQIPNLTFFAEKSIISGSLFFHSKDFVTKALSLLEAAISYDEKVRRSSLGLEIIDKKGVCKIVDIVGGLF